MLCSIVWFLKWTNLYEKCRPPQCQRASWEHVQLRRCRTEMPSRHVTSRHAGAAVWSMWSGTFSAHKCHSGWVDEKILCENSHAESACCAAAARLSFLSHGTISSRSSSRFVITRLSVCYNSSYWLSLQEPLAATALTHCLCFVQCQYDARVK